jgi:hypothetical protein
MCDLRLRVRGMSFEMLEIELGGPGRDMGFLVCFGGRV